MGRTAAPTKALRDARRKSGLCFCGEPPRAGFTTCESCARKQMAYSERHRAKKRANGQCVCGSPLATKYHCIACAQRHSDQIATTSLKRISEGKCPRCLGPNPRSKYACDVCIEKRRSKKAALQKAWRARQRSGWVVPREITMALYRLDTNRLDTTR